MGWRVWHCALPYRWAPLSFQMEESATPNIVWRLLVMRSWKFHFCGKPRQNIVQVAWLPAYLYDYCHFDIFLFTSLWISGKKLIIIVIITDNFYIALFSSLQRLTAIYICSCAILGMHQKFFDTWYYWTHQTKVGGGRERIIFFTESCFSICTMACVETTCYTGYTLLTSALVDLGVSSTALSTALWRMLAFNCFFLSTSWE